jgi:hypothetical protein
VYETILKEIDAEIARLQQARTLLAGVSIATKRGLGRPPAKQAAAPTTAKKARKPLSAEAREKMRQAQLKRWAATKKSAKKSTQ